MCASLVSRFSLLTSPALRYASLLGLTLVCLISGCAGSGATTAGGRVPDDERLRELATTCVRRGLVYPEIDAVRAQAVEAAAEVMGPDAPMLIREALKDEHPGVRFAACMALGRLQDADSLPRLREMLAETDPNVRIGIFFALERMGDTSHRIEWRDLLRRHENPIVRRNAAMALGRLGNKQVVPLLDTSFHQDKDEGVRVQVLEGLAILGDREAIQHMLYDAQVGGGRQVFALLTLGQVDDDRVGPTLRSRLDGSDYLEARLAAARSLADHGSPRGLKLALESLTWSKPDPNLPDDPPANQAMRVQSMAAMALGRIGDRQALPALAQRMQNSDDPRVQLAAATATLMILNRSA